MAFFGTPAKTEQVNRFTPQQMQQQAGVGQLGYQGLQNTPLDFNPIRQRIMREFETKTVPGLLERLNAFQGPNVQNSSALGGQLIGGLENLGGTLAAQESQYNLQKFNQLLNAFQQGQQPQFDIIQHAAQPGFLDMLLGGSASALPYAANSLSAGSGNKLRSLLSSLGGGSTQSSVSPVGSPVSGMQGSTNPSLSFPNQPFNSRNLYQATSAFPMGMPNFF